MHVSFCTMQVQGLQDQARGAKDRLEQCRDNSTRLTRRFLLVLQKIHVRAAMPCHATHR
jgi:hypothetical protein